MSIMGVMLAACADEGGPSFAPDAATETAVRALTPPPTATTQVIDRQPGERDDPDRSIADLASGRGNVATTFNRDGGTITVYDTATGAAQPIRLPDPDTIVAAAVSTDGSAVVLLRRTTGGLTLERIDRDGATLGSLVLSSDFATPSTDDSGTPSAGSQTAGTPSIEDQPAVTRDRLEISPDGRHVVAVSRDGVLHIANVEGPPALVRVVQDFGDVSILSWTGDGALALVATYDQTRSTASLTGVPLEGRLRSILRLPAGDERRIVFVASPTDSPDVYYVARSVNEDWTAQNNLYRIPLVGGTPSIVLSTGLSGPAGAVDRFAVADDGKTIAAVILIPRGSDLVFHSLWVADVTAGRPQQVDTGPLGLVSRIAWTSQGLYVLGVQRERERDTTRLATLSLLLDQEGRLDELDRSVSAATPIASPVGSPRATTPVASPVD